MSNAAGEQGSNSGQNVSQSFGDVSISMGGDSANLDISNVQNQVGDNSQAAAATGQSKATNSREETVKEALDLIQTLKQEVAQRDDISDAQQQAVEENLQTVATEVQKPEPDKSVVERTMAKLEGALGHIGQLAPHIVKLTTTIAPMLSGMPPMPI